MDPLPIVLPATQVPPRRAPLPFLAAGMPVIVGVVLWLITGSLFSLCFAALGPLMMVASLVDSSRGRRKEQRRILSEEELSWVAVEDQLSSLHAEERRRRWSQHPDAATCAQDPPLRGTEPPEGRTLVVVGSGGVSSSIRTTGGDGERARNLQERARVLESAPLPLPLGAGICVRGPQPLTIAVARALVLQLCLRFAPGQLKLVGEGFPDGDYAGLPHASSVRRGFRLGVGFAQAREVESDATIWLAQPGEEVPDGILTVLDLQEPREATLRTPEGVVVIGAEGISRQQFETLASGRLASDDETDAVPETVEFAQLVQTPGGSGLRVAIGRGAGADGEIDIVEDGPHAIVTGTTGTGKSELLVTWVTAMAASYGPDRVNFVLADFKGGTAFEPLRALAQVAAVMTDLDEAGARRGVESLRAELRRREAALAAAGVRDIAEVEIPRLLIVVDEFAALLQEHPDLGAVFTDIAARGRALGMHLILGTQRASGVVRDSLAANCPLRLSLRVSDPSDSRAMIGTAAAAEIPGGASARGLCLVRRPQDDDAEPIRVALTREDDLGEVVRRWAHAPQPSSPWLLPLAETIPLPEETTRAGASEIPWGIVDVPESQAQPRLVLRAGKERGVAVIGAPGSGRTSALRVLAAQASEALWIPADAERMWDVVQSLVEGRTRMPALVLCDDLDARVAELPPEYAQTLLQRWEQILRDATGSSVVISATRSSGAVGRVLDALPRRALLRAASRVDHVAAGGESATFDERRPPGRARLDGHETQFFWTPDGGASDARAGIGDDESERWEPQPWGPGAELHAIVTAGAASLLSAVQQAYPSARVSLIGSTSGAGAGATAVVGAGQGVTQPGGGREHEPLILLGDADAWQREWSLWQRVRAEGEVLIRAERPSDLRQLVGHRELPPFARLHAGRVWAVRGAETPRRLVVPALLGERSTWRRAPEAAPATATAIATRVSAQQSSDQPRTRRSLRERRP
ncbi:FtsK/SpoIIIE domain-containing protein [Microbacterium sp. NPDC090225]|uniref:FtsK/SpoIIIE domain-containing protein n=1 Tax=Microbacterium sp. NPDC090225 TaxID=3364207 RepID=UPI0038266677